VTEFAGLGDKVRLILEDSSGIQRKRVQAFLTPHRDESQGFEAYIKYGVLIEIHLYVGEAHENDIIPCRPRYQEAVPLATKSVLKVIPKAPLSSKLRIEATLGDEVVPMSITNYTSEKAAEDILSVKWGTQVDFTGEKPTLRVGSGCEVEGPGRDWADEGGSDGTGDVGNQAHHD
jgi:hypothetical protein